MVGREEGSMSVALKANREVVKDYFHLFVNRQAYVVQSMRPHPESGHFYYYRPKAKGTDKPMCLTNDTIRRHLEGALTVGLYAIDPASQRCKWVAIDADYKDAMEDLLKLQFYLTQDHVSPALEMSRRGGHLWIFLEAPQLARDCRIYIYNLALRLGVPVKGAGLAEGIEIFPKQDELRRGEFGNAIRGPLGIHRGAGKRFWFYGANYTLEEQMAYLKRLRKVTAEELGRFVEGKSMPTEATPARRSSTAVVGYAHTGAGVFNILDHVRNPRKVGRNYVTRCPSCAEAGHDRSGDNLAISIDEPRKYKCWAGCTKEMIRAALGVPIPIRQSA
jgi:hypothetical protein